MKETSFESLRGLGPFSLETAAYMGGDMTEAFKALSDLTEPNSDDMFVHPS